MSIYIRLWTIYNMFCVQIRLQIIYNMICYSLFSYITRIVAKAIQFVTWFSNYLFCSIIFCYRDRKNKECMLQGVLLHVILSSVFWLKCPKINVEHNWWELAAWQSDPLEISIIHSQKINLACHLCPQNYENIWNWPKSKWMLNKV